MDWMWIMTTIAIAGAILNVYKRWEGFLLWLVSNTAWVIIDYSSGLYAQAGLFLFYSGLSAYGLIKWRSEDEHKER